METFFCVLYLVTLLGLLWYFKSIRRKDSNRAANKIMLLYKGIELNESQLEIRKAALMNYDLLRYNLQESLVVQREISI